MCESPGLYESVRAQGVHQLQVGRPEQVRRPAGLRHLLGHGDQDEDQHLQGAAAQRQEEGHRQHHGKSKTGYIDMHSNLTLPYC